MIALDELTEGRGQDMLAVLRAYIVTQLDQTETKNYINTKNKKKMKSDEVIVILYES